MRIKCELYFADRLLFCWYVCTVKKYLCIMNKYVVFTVTMVAAICISAVWESVTWECWTSIVYLVGIVGFLVYDLRRMEPIRKERTHYIIGGCVSVGIMALGALFGQNIVFIPCLLVGTILGLITISKLMDAITQF